MYFGNEINEEKKEKMRLTGSLICPGILKKLNACIMESTKWSSISCGEVIFEVTLWPKRFIVHLGNNTCTCRLWDLTGVPCIHACAAIISIRAGQKIIYKNILQETISLGPMSIK
ncbi:unnamed protein product [Cuscuta epithymum]|uniref:SWIM-type domain-containing protein n=1 Tax=Cuscuta epithymum TaxID=186058 RepID=A0AAV0G0G4_9ASTE|nr:unnamed protein product [Cuscuta epithymum]